MTAAVRPSDLAIAQGVVCSMLLPRAQPPQLRREFGDILACHRHLDALGFRLVERRDGYGGPRLESGAPLGPILVWRNERVIVRIKTRGEPATAEHRPCLAHMSVCLVSGAMHGPGRVDTRWGAEVGKFTYAGRLVEKTPAAVTRSVPEHLAKSERETWADDTHFVFPDLVCDDTGVDTLIPFPF